MKQQESNRSISPGLIAAISAAVIAVGGGVVWFTLNSPKSPVGIDSPSQVVPTTPPEQEPVPQEQNVSIFWLQDTGTSFKLVPQPVEVNAGDNPEQKLETAFQTLLAGPTEGTGATTIPQGTELLSLRVEDDNIYVNLSEEYEEGGGSASMTGRVGQIVYTATSLAPNAKVFIEVNGEQLEVLGGEGLVLEQPLTRESFNQNFSL
jgi:spore germination protein GerM